LGRTVHLRGAAPRAVDLLTEARILARANVVPTTEAAAICGLGEIYADTDDPAAAIDCVEAGLALVDRLDEAHAAITHNAAGAVHRICGRPDRAIHHHTQALRTFAIGVGAYLRCEALLGLSNAYRDLRRP